MDINNASESWPGAFRAEFRVCMVSTSCDTRAERDVLHRDVFPHLHHCLSERGGLLRVSDPRWEAMLEPNRASEIVKAGLENLYGYRPFFIGILGGEGSHAGAYPWLRDIAGDAGIALQYMTRVVNSGMMRDRSLFYILDMEESNGSSSSDSSHDVNDAQRIVERLRRDGYVVREGISNLDELARLILNDMVAFIERRFARGGSMSALERDRRVQAQIADEHRRAYVEIGSYIDRLHDDVLGNGHSVAVIGESGSGKSALLVNWVDDIRASVRDVVVISRFVGAGEDDLVSVLRHIMLDLREYCGVQEVLENDVEALVGQFTLWLAHAPADRILVIVVDGADRLVSDALGLRWLSGHLPKNIRLVVSGVSIAPPALPTWTELHMQPLTLAQTRLITDRLIVASGRSSTPEFVQRIVDTVPRPSPLFLRTVVHYAQSGSRVVDADDFNDVGSVEELMDRILRQGEDRCGVFLTGRVLGLLHCTRKGLTREDLLALTAADPDVISQVMAEFEHYMVDRDGVLSYIHDHVRHAVERRYITGDNDMRRLHADLAGYFATQPVGGRRIEEEPWHWQRTGDCERLIDCITDLPTFMAFSSEDRLLELLGYCLAVDDVDAIVACYEKHLADRWAIAQDVSESAEILERLGRFFTIAGWLPQAEHFLRKALESKRELFGEMHVNVAAAMHDLAELLRHAGRFAEAEQCYLSVLAIREGQLDPLAPSLAGALSDLALLYRCWGRRHQALPFYLRALALKEQIHGPDHLETAETLNDLALLNHDLGDLEAAVALNRRALEIRKGHFGPNHPVVATSHNNLGSVYRDMGNPGAAEREYRMALTIGEDRLGADHPHTIGTVANLASLLQFIGALDESRSLFRRAIDTTIATLGAGHPNVTAFSINYAHVLRDTGNLAGAEDVLRVRLNHLRADPDAPPYLAMCANNLAAIVRLRGRCDEALLFYAMAVEDWERSLHPNHPNVASALQNMAGIHFGRGDASNAEPFARRARAIRRQYFGEEHELTRQSATLLTEIEIKLAANS